MALGQIFCFTNSKNKKIHDAFPPRNVSSAAGGHVFASSEIHVLVANKKTHFIFLFWVNINLKQMQTWIIECPLWAWWLCVLRLCATDWKVGSSSPSSASWSLKQGP